MRNAMTGRKLAGTVLALGVATASVIFGSYAAWTATTTNPGNSVTADTFVFTNSKNTASVFTAATDVVPGDSDTDTVTLTNGSGALAQAVEVTQDNLSAANALSGALKLSIHDDTTDTCIYPAGAFGTSGGSCAPTANWDGSATVAGLGIQNIANTSNEWPAGEAHVISVSWEFPAATGGTTGQGLAASFDLTFTADQV